jgi:uncharacterized protein YycO
MPKFLKRLYFSLISKCAYYFAKAIGPIHSPFTHKQISYGDILRLKGYLKEGDILLTRTNGELTTYAIPGFFKHTIFYLGPDENGQDKVIEAVKEGVRENYLINTLMKTDNVAVMRIKNLTPEELKFLKEYTTSLKGKEYDFGLKIWDEDSLYCSEVMYHGICKSRGYDYLKLKENFGFPSFTPQHIYENYAVFDLIFEKSDRVRGKKYGL